MSLSSLEIAQDRGNVEHLRLVPTRAHLTLFQTRTEEHKTRSVFTHQIIGGTAAAKSNEHNGAALSNLTERADYPQTVVRVREKSEALSFRTPTPTFYALQEWEGYVVTIRDKHFTARLVDLSVGASIEQEEAEIPLCELTGADAERISQGSIFRWAVGYEHSPSDVKKRISVIVFRDLPALTKSDQETGNTWATKILASLPE